MQTTGAFHEKLASVNMTKLIGSVGTWMHSKHIAGLVFYHRRHNKLPVLMQGTRNISMNSYTNWARTTSSCLRWNLSTTAILRETSPLHRTVTSGEVAGFGILFHHVCPGENDGIFQLHHQRRRGLSGCPQGTEVVFWLRASQHSDLQRDQRLCGGSSVWHVLGRLPWCLRSAASPRQTCSRFTGNSLRIRNLTSSY